MDKDVRKIKQAYKEMKKAAEEFKEACEKYGQVNEKIEKHFESEEYKKVQELIKTYQKKSR